MNLILERVGNYIASKESDRELLRKEKEQLLRKLKIIRSNKNQALMREAAKALAGQVFLDQVQLIHQENTFRVFTMAKVCVMKACFILARSVTLDLHDPNDRVNAAGRTGRENWDQQMGFVSFRSESVCDS